MMSCTIGPTDTIFIPAGYFFCEKVAAGASSVGIKSQVAMADEDSCEFIKQLTDAFQAAEEIGSNPMAAMARGYASVVMEIRAASQ